MLVKNFSSKRSCLISRNSTVCLDIENELVKVGLLSYTSIFNSVINLEDRCIDRVDSDCTDKRYEVQG